METFITTDWTIYAGILGWLTMRIALGMELRFPPKPIFKLTPEQAREVSRRRNAGEECLPIARDFGITRQHVGVLARRLQL